MLALASERIAWMSPNVPCAGGTITDPFTI